MFLCLWPTVSRIGLGPHAARSGAWLGLERGRVLNLHLVHGALSVVISYLVSPRQRGRDGKREDDHDDKGDGTNSKYGQSEAMDVPLYTRHARFCGKRSSIGGLRA